MRPPPPLLGSEMPGSATDQALIVYIFAEYDKSTNLAIDF